MADGGLCQVLGILIIDPEGQRLAVKYSKAGKELWPDIKKQTAFEKRVASKLPKPQEAAKSEPDVTIVDDHTVLFQAANDVVVCVIAAPNENELMVVQIVECIWAAMIRAAPPSLLSNGPTRQLVVDFLSDVMFFLDEVIDDGMIMEVDEEKVHARIRMQDEMEAASSAQVEQMFQKATQSAKTKLINSLMGRT
mmetsp:Transcript_30486/g.97427  ORF Transcript_30486/g.97427 Transcript_30486/m.97427 type:complete len:194 (-) Transcript_30486:105-686(-)